MRPRRGARADPGPKARETPGGQAVPRVRRRRQADPKRLPELKLWANVAESGALSTGPGFSSKSATSAGQRYRIRGPLPPTPRDT